MLVVQLLCQLASVVDLANSNVFLFGWRSLRSARRDNGIFTFLEASLHHSQCLSLAIRLIHCPGVESVAGDSLMLLVNVSHAGKIVRNVVVFKVRTRDSTDPTLPRWRTPVLVTELEHSVIPYISGTGSDRGCIKV